MSAVGRGGGKGLNVSGSYPHPANAATQPCWEMTWGSQAIRAVTGHTPWKCTALHSCSVLLCTALHSCSVLFCAALCCSGHLPISSFGLTLRDSGKWTAGFSVTSGPVGKVRWLCSSHVLKRQASLCNLKLLAEMVGYGVSAPVIKFFHWERVKFSPPYRAKGVQWAQGSSCGHRTSWL